MKFSRRLIASLVFVTGSAYAAAPVTSLNTSTSTLESRIATLERLVQSRGEIQLQMQQQLNTLQDELSELRGVSEVHAHKLEQLNNRQRELYQELEERFTSSSTSTNAARTPVAPTALTQPQDKAVANVAMSASLDENQAYDRAVNLVLKDRRYEQAIPEFKAFIKSYPQSGYLPNAYYWLGQLLFNKAQYVEAESAFLKVVNDFPDSLKRSDAILKLGMVAQKKNDLAKAKQLFEQVVSEYPESVSAKLATSRLQSLTKS
jgi:tol-pal system protein YbgF